MAFQDAFERWVDDAHARGALWGEADAELALEAVSQDDVDDLLEGVWADAESGRPIRGSRLPRLRPVLVVLAARAAGASAVDRELQYAAELLYLALAVHDVALGRSGNRRRRLARRVLAGLDWLGGNHLLVRAMELVRTSGPPETLGELVDTVSALQRGQQLALSLQGDTPWTVPLWQEHADGHTGAIFAFCCRVGASMAGAPEPDAFALRRYGRHIGRMWHVAEDLCLLRGEHAAEHLLARGALGRPMLPIAALLEQRPDRMARWQEVVAAHCVDGAAGFLSEARRSGALARSREVVARESWSARKVLTRLPPSTYRHALDRLASGLAKAPFEAWSVEPTSDD